MKVHADNFCAAPGEPFSFSDAQGQVWQGSCSRLVPTGNNEYQVDGILREGNAAFKDCEVTVHYDAATSEAVVLPL